MQTAGCRRRRRRYPPSKAWLLLSENMFWGLTEQITQPLVVNWLSSLAFCFLKAFFKSF